MLIVGVDEVGRGPLAGPVTVGVVACSADAYTRLKRNRKLPPKGFDSKKLTPQAREDYARVLKLLSKESVLHYAVVHVSHKIIDTKGLSFAIKAAIVRSLKKLSVHPGTSTLFLDGGLKAPKQFSNQMTIIKGDEKEKIIAWASILAKVSRDHLMLRAAKKFPEYGFEAHKGYATKFHRLSIQRVGLSEFHRKSFCRNLTK